MKNRTPILSLCFIWLNSFLPNPAHSQANSLALSFDFYGEPIELTVDKTSIVPFDSPLNIESVQYFIISLNNSKYDPLITSLTAYKNKYKLDDWVYYQLVRKVAQQVSPKKENYYRYTLYKWFLLTKSGFDATLKTNNDKLLFYVRTDEAIYNIPYYMKDNKQYVCLNYHDYGSHIDFEKEKFAEILNTNEGSLRAFSYKVNQLPAFHSGDYQEREIKFSLNENEYDFKIKLNPLIKTIFANYPVVDYESYFNIPLSNETYNTLIPALKETIKGMSVKFGVDYLMRFTRYAFLYGADSKNFGMEKRLSPEQTLLYEQSDCEDRAALFFYLVKEIYNLPMIVLSFSEHVTIAVKFDKPVGTPIIYNGETYSVCEPTPQKRDLKIGQLMPGLLKTPYEVAYSYTPANH